MFIGRLLIPFLSQYLGLSLNPPNLRCSHGVPLKFGVHLWISFHSFKLCLAGFSCYKNLQMVVSFWVSMDAMGCLILLMSGAWDYFASDRACHLWTHHRLCHGAEAKGHVLLQKKSWINGMVYPCNLINSIMNLAIYGDLEDIWWWLILGFTTVFLLSGYRMVRLQERRAQKMLKFWPFAPELSRNHSSRTCRPPYRTPGSV